MRDGFKYKGRHCEQMDLHYAPGPDEIRNRMESYSVSTQQAAGRDGGYYLGATANMREFELECYFEEITEKQYAAIMEWLRRDEGGELIFDDRPYVVYDVWPTKAVKPTVYMTRGETEMLLSGTQDITFTAYCPFGRMTTDRYDGATDMTGAMSDTGILESKKVPAAPTVDSKQFLFYNCGTEKASTVIRLAGDVDSENGLLITNNINGTKCGVIGLTGTAIPEGGWLEINGELGQVYVVIGDEKRLAFEFHDLGYLQLEPCTPFTRDVLVTCENGSRLVNSNIGAFAGVKAGQYIWLEEGWHYIGRVISDYQIELNTALTQDASVATDIVTMNNITVEGATALTLFEIDYIPRTR